MSRSRKKTPVIGNCGSRHHTSEKKEKRLFNRKMRHKNKQILNVNDAEKMEGKVFKHKDEIEDMWGFSKDGKRRIDPKKEPKEMRK